MTHVAFQQVDVFTETPYRGNPLAVIMDGSSLSDAQMQQIAHWTNLSETTFLLPPTHPDADYRVRIFTTIGELPFAGHPTLGSCHAWLKAGGRPKSTRIVQQCQAGLIPIRQAGGQLAFAAPPLLRTGPLSASELDQVRKGLSLAPGDVLHAQWCDNGPGWMGLVLGSAEQVLSVRLMAEHLAGLKVGIIGAYTGRATGPGMTPAPDFEVRAFFPRDGGMFEDPVTGSLNAAFATWLIGAGIAPAKYVVSQGTALGRQGRVHIEQDAEGTWVGGASTTVIDGHISLGLSA